MINHITLQGYFGADPILRKTPAGQDVLTFNLGVRRDDKTTDWITCVAWNAAAVTISDYFKKGDEIVVEGRLQTRDWTDKNGTKRKEYEVITKQFHFTNGKKNSEKNEKNIENCEEKFAVSSGELPF